MSTHRSARHETIEAAAERRRRFLREAAKLDPEEERTLAEEGMAAQPRAADGAPRASDDRQCR